MSFYVMLTDAYLFQKHIGRREGITDTFINYLIFKLVLEVSKSLIRIQANDNLGDTTLKFK